MRTLAPAQGNLTRESLTRGAGRSAEARARLGSLARSDEELDDCLRATLAAKPVDARAEENADNADVWLFGYGSLIWNPLIEFAEKEVATVHGFHRKFCLYSRVNRGTPEAPGLVLGLDRGGAVKGVAFRIRADQAWHELSLVWRREMLLASYVPTWAAARFADGTRRRVLTFVVRKSHPASACNIAEDTAAIIIASARGTVGPCRDYLTQTVDSLRAHGILDRNLERLARKVAAF